MNAFVFTAFRHLTCVAAAVLISIVMAMSFVQSTATVPAAHSPVAAARAASA
jgi:hypothetical protein